MIICKEEMFMSIELLISGIFSIILLVYLAITIIFPEKF